MSRTPAVFLLPLVLLAVRSAVAGFFRGLLLVAQVHASCGYPSGLYAAFRTVICHTHRTSAAKITAGADILRIP